MSELLRILLLEDDEGDYFICKWNLHDAYHESLKLTWASSFDEGLELALNSSFDVYLVDYRLGEKSGIDWLVELTKKNKKQLPPAILLTGISNAEIDILAGDTGFSDFISKTEMTASMLERSIRYARHHHQILAKLSSSQADYKRLHDSAFDAILQFDTHGTILSCNPSAETMFGYTSTKLIGYSFNQLIENISHHHELEVDYYSIDTWKGYTIGVPEEVSALYRDGAEILLEMLINQISNGNKTHFVVTLRDITERKKREETLKYEASHDLLTGMHNRRYFLNRAEQEIKRAKRFNRSLLIMMLDIDHFKAVNDTYGHAAGDEVIKYVSKTIMNTIRSIDIVARWGGEEFIVLLPETELTNGIVIAEKIRKKVLANSITHENQTILVTISIGVTNSTDDCSADDFIKRADQALYHAKETGRNKVCQL